VDAQIRISRIPAIGPMENAVLSVSARDARILIAQILGRLVRTKVISALPMVVVPVPETQWVQNLCRVASVPENPIPTVRAGLPKDVPAHQRGEIPGATERIRSDRHIGVVRAAVELGRLALE
jgi:hypothetical protein